MLVFFLILVLAFGGYLYYQRTIGQSSLTSRRVLTPQMKITQTPLNLVNFTKVLGAATSSLVDTGRSLLDSATDGQAEPLINRTLNNLQREVKDLPREQYDKVKAEFCQDVVQEYERQK